MKLLDKLKGIFRNANGIRNNADVKRRNDCGRVHSYTSRRERAISDISCVRMLVKKEKLKSSGTANSGTSSSLRELVSSLGELVSKRTGESIVYWNASENAYEEIAKFLLNEHGLIQEDRYWFGNELLAITDVGSRGDNILKGDNGELYFIDPLIRLKKPAIEVIEALVGKIS